MKKHLKHFHSNSMTTQPEREFKKPTTIMGLLQDQKAQMRSDFSQHSKHLSRESLDQTPDPPFSEGDEPVNQAQKLIIDGSVVSIEESASKQETARLEPLKGEPLTKPKGVSETNGKIVVQGGSRRHSTKSVAEIAGWESDQPVRN